MNSTPVFSELLQQSGKPARKGSGASETLGASHNEVGHHLIDSYLLGLARMSLENKRSFLGRRCGQRSEAVPIVAREAVRRTTKAVLADILPVGHR